MAGDPFCAGGFNLGAHLDYTQKYDTAASTFVQGKLNAAGSTDRVPRQRD